MRILVARVRKEEIYVGSLRDAAKSVNCDNEKSSMIETGTIS